MADSSTPGMGEKVFVSGYPAGVTLPILTEGFVSGWSDGYVMTSAPAFSGNSGGPVFYKGKLIGLLVRTSTRYPHITLAASLQDCLKRIEESPTP